jgi:hypothetical protein
MDLDPTVENGSGREAHRRVQLRRLAALTDDGEVAPVIFGGGGVAYGVQEWMASSKVWSVTMEVSCGDGERRPEKLLAAVVFG